MSTVSFSTGEIPSIGSFAKTQNAPVNSHSDYMRKRTETAKGGPDPVREAVKRLRGFE